MNTTMLRRTRRFKANKSRGSSDVSGASYSRSTTHCPSEPSIVEQQNAIAIKANRDGVAIPDDNHFADAGIWGTVHRREGLDALLIAAGLGRFRVLYMCDLCRLSRDPTMLISIINELVSHHGVRVVSLQDGFDTGKPGWRRHIAIFRPTSN